jgi:hypothetical protein
MSRVEDFCWRCGLRAVLRCIEGIGFLCAECRASELSRPPSNSEAK